MTKDEAIKVLKMVEAHGLADKAKSVAIEALETEAIPVEWIRKYTEENRLYQSDDFDLYISDMIADWAERKEE